MLSVIHVLGSMLMMFSATYVLPIVTSISFGAGALIWAVTRHDTRELRSRDGFLLVTLAWVLMSVIATVPLLLAVPGLSFTDAFFETMSGLTTTGATVLVGLEHLPPSINLWRHGLNWYGGMGIIVLVVAILPLLGVGGLQLYKAETPGPMKDEKLTPRITQTAAAWPVFAPMTILMLSCYCANTGSTGGGIKMFRTLVLFRQAGREVVRAVHPQVVAPVKIGGQVVANKIVLSLLTFALMSSGLDLVSAFSAIIACINNAGPGLGLVGPAGNYQGLSDFQTWVCSLAMLLGRLEIFSVLVLFTPMYWRK